MGLLTFRGYNTKVEYTATHCSPFCKLCCAMLCIGIFLIITGVRFFKWKRNVFVTLETVLYLPVFVYSEINVITSNELVENLVYFYCRELHTFNSLKTIQRKKHSKREIYDYQASYYTNETAELLDYLYEVASVFSEMWVLSVRIVIKEQKCPTPS